MRNVDVTVVYPLPSAGGDDLLKPSDRPDEGPYLAASMFPDGVPDLDVVSPVAEADRLASLRAVAVRFDPCPRLPLPPGAGATCEPEIRVVFQSIADDGKELGARDGAVHVFYRASMDDFAEVVRQLRALRAERASEPETILGVSPTLRSEGLEGPYAQRLRALVRRHAIEKNAVRVTHFAHTVEMPATWELGIRERTASGWSSVPIPSTQTNGQKLVTIVGGRWDADITPAVAESNDVTRVFAVSSKEDMRAAFGTTVRVLNPRIHSSESVDCATCHIAPSVAAFVRQTQRIEVASYEDRFQSSYPVASTGLSDEDAVAFKNIHMLSYLGRVLNVSPRAANETAAVLEVLEAAGER